MIRFINLCCSNKSVREKNSKEKESRGNTVEEMISQILKNPREKILERKNFKENDQVSKIYRWKSWKQVLNTNRKYKIFFYNLMSKSKRLYYNSRTIFTLGKKKEKITKSIYTLLTYIFKQIQKNLNRYQISVNNYNFKRPKKKKK